jgi:hypothetical protein
MIVKLYQLPFLETRTSYVDKQVKLYFFTNRCVMNRMPKRQEELSADPVYLAMVDTITTIPVRSTSVFSSFMADMLDPSCRGA